MLTMITNSWRAEYHVLNREGTAALCRKNLTPYEWPTYGPDGKNVGTTTAVYKVAGETSARHRDDHRVTCLACERKLAKILDEDYPVAHHLYGDVLNRKALSERAARKARAIDTTNTGISYLVIDEDPNSEDFETVFEVLGVRLDTDGTWVVGLRNRRTNETHVMTSRAMTVSRRFRALPLDQVSQDRKDARDIEAAHAEALHLNQACTCGEVRADHGADGCCDASFCDCQEFTPWSPKVAEYPVLDTATGRRFAALGTTAAGSRATNIWLRALDTQQVEHMFLSTFALVRDFVAVCDHGYGQRDSCPGCDHDQEMAQAARTFDELKSTQVAESLRRTPIVGGGSLTVTKSGLPTTDYQLGRALYFVRALLDPNNIDMDLTARARAFLVELDAQ